jgi:chemotaxis protein MotB
VSTILLEAYWAFFRGSYCTSKLSKNESIQNELTTEEVTMRKIPIIVLLVLLAAAILLISEKKVSSLDEKITQSNQEKAALEEQIRESAEHFEKRVSSLDEKIIQLNQEKAALEEQVRESAEHFEKLKNAKERISELENVINMRDRSISDFEDRLLKLKSDSEENQKTIAALKAELASRGILVTQVKGRLEGTTSQIVSLKEEVARVETETGMLQRSLSDLKGEEARLKTKIGQLQSTHNTIVSELKSQIQNKEVSIKELEEKLSITFVDRILFESGRATITREGRVVLGKVGDILKNVRGKQIRVVGHTDNKPILPRYQSKFPSNWELSAARAGAVARYFQKEIGLDPTNMEAVGCSFYEPIASNETKEGRAQNRRVNIIIAPKIE